MSSIEIPPLFLERLKQIIPHPLYDLADLSFVPKAKASFRINTLKTDIDSVHVRLQEQGFKADRVAWYEPAFLVPAQDYKALLASEMAQEGQIYAQALSSMVPVIALDPRPGERVLDLCAAPGSKTSQIAMQMHNQGELVANEAIRARFYRLKAVTELMGAAVKLSMKDGRRFNLPIQGAFDRILVDAPCSSEGRFDRHDPDSFKYWGKRKIEEMAHKQKGLLLNASRLLRAGGTLVYATCTFAPEENEEVVDWFLKKAEGHFQLQEISLTGLRVMPALEGWGRRSFDPQVNKCLRLLPDELMEGFFVAKIIKT